jgi:site-specific DNA recombinase
MRQAVAYIRVSTDEQVSGTSLDSQEKACREFAAQNKLEMPDENIFREEGESAKIMNRPQLARMLEFCSKNRDKVAECIVWKVDRLARRAEFHHIIKANLAKLGIKLVSVTEPIGDDPMGTLFENVLASFAQFDNEIRTARTTGGMRARSEQGGWCHDAPYGYKKIRTASGFSTVEPNEDSAKLKILFNEFIGGSMTVKQAVKRAAQIGIKTKKGNPYGWQNMKNMLLNPLYAGFVCTKYTDDRYVQGVHEPIIDVITHYKLKSAVDKQFRRLNKSNSDNYPLRGGFLQCTYCHNPITGNAPRGRDKHYPRYSCTKCRKYTGVPATSKNRDDVHEEFIELLKSVKPKESTIQLFKEAVLCNWNKEFKHAVNYAQTLDSELAALRNKKSKIVDLFVEGRLSDIDKENKLNEVEKFITDIELKKASAGELVKDKEQIVDAAVMFLSHPEDFWNLGSLEVKKQLQVLIFPEGLTYDFSTGFGTAKLNNSYLLMKNIALSGDKNRNLVAGLGLEPRTSWL